MFVRDNSDFHKGALQDVPHNIELEQAIIGAVLMNNDNYDIVQSIIDQHSFYDPVHGAIYALIVSMIERQHPASPITLKPAVQTWPMIDDGLHVWQYLGRLVVQAAGRSQLREYATELADMSARRRLVGLAQDVMAWVGEAGTEVSAGELVDRAEKALFEITAKRTEGREVGISNAVSDALASISAAYERGGQMAGVLTGLTDLDALLGGLQPSDLIIIGGRPAMGKAQPIDAPVKMRNGEWKKIGDLRMGDALASIDGAVSIVSGVYPQGRKQIFRITFSDGRTAECCADHWWRVHNRKWSAPKLMTTTDIMSLMKKPSMKKRLWIDLVSGHFGSNQNLPVEPWTLGALLGNGNLSGGTPLFSTSSTHTAYELKKAIGDNFRMEQCSAYDFRIVQTQGCSRPGIYGACENPLTASIRLLGLYGKRSEQKFIPAAYKNADRGARMALLRGLLDTDGWVEKHGSVRFGTSSPKLRDDVCELVRSLGGICTVGEKISFYTYKGERKAGLPTFTLNIMMSDYSECFSEPKKVSRIKEKNGITLLSFVSIEPVDERHAVCISVTHPSRLYVTSDYVVTHNTAIVTTIAYNVAKERVDAHGEVCAGDHVHFFSQEMSAQQLAMRLMAERAEIASDAMRRGNVSEDQFREIIARSREVASASITIDETGGITLASLAAKARRVKRKHDTKLIVVDYLQLMSGANRSGDNRVQEITKLTMGLKALAKELDVPIVALSQLSRKVEERSDKRPQLADLRESGSIEQDADVVMFVYRDEYYLEREKPEFDDMSKYTEWMSRMERVRGTGEVIIGKHRHGPVGTVHLSFQSQFTRFGNLAKGAPHAS